MFYLKKHISHCTTSFPSGKTKPCSKALYKKQDAKKKSFKAQDMIVSLLKAGQ